MSFDATNWAIKQRGMKPAAKIVLWHLCDRYHPDHGCFPSQDTLAADCELSRSTLNVHLDALEEAGLIGREQRRKAGSKQQERTKYFFPFEPDFHSKFGKKPSPETGHGPVSENEGEPCPENDESRVRNPDSNPVREPVREPVISREGVREGEEGQTEDPRKVEDAFWALVKVWPGVKGMPRGKALKAWQDLSAIERQEASQAFPRWIELLKAQRKDHPPGPYSYFHEKLWHDLPALEEAAKPTSGMAAPFGKLWSGARLAELMMPPPGRITPPTALENLMIREGKTSLEAVIDDKRMKMGWPRVNTMIERARNGQGWLCPLALEEAVSGFHAVRRDGDLYQAWRDEHARRGWPFLDDARPMERVYFPAIAEGATDHASAVRAALDAFAEQISDYLKTRSRGDDHAA